MGCMLLMSAAFCNVWASCSSLRSCHFRSTPHIWPCVVCFVSLCVFFAYVYLVLFDLVDSDFLISRLRLYFLVFPGMGNLSRRCALFFFMICLSIWSICFWVFRIVLFARLLFLVLPRFPIFGVHVCVAPAVYCVLRLGMLRVVHGVWRFGYFPIFLAVLDALAVLEAVLALSLSVCLQASFGVSPGCFSSDLHRMWFSPHFPAYASCGIFMRFSAMSIRITACCRRCSMFPLHPCSAHALLTAFRYLLLIMM